MIAQQTKTATSNIKNVAAKVETLAMGLLLVWDREICTVLQSGLSHTLVLIKTFCVFKPFQPLIIVLRLIRQEQAKHVLFDDGYEQAQATRVTIMAGGRTWIDHQNCWTKARRLGDVKLFDHKGPKTLKTA
jgi:hypothetical protein